MRRMFTTILRACDCAKARRQEYPQREEVPDGSGEHGEEAARSHMSCMGAAWFIDG